MRAPTPSRFARACTDVEGLDQQVDAAMATIRAELGELVDDSPIDQAVSTVEMFIAVAVRVLRKTNPSKVRSEARNVEIQARMDGKPESGAPALAGPPQLDAASAPARRADEAGLLAVSGRLDQPVRPGAETSNA